MSRFARLESGPVLTWAPPESPIKIEYSAALIREVRMASAGVDAFGVLYGVRRSGTIRLVATRGRAGLDPVGVFAWRVRGEVFLTEEDLERIEKAEASVALVIAGDCAGFFVKDADGSIDAVRSYEEFRVTPRPVEPARPKSRPKNWRWAAALAVIPLFFMRVPHPHQPMIELSLHENSGQIQIGWNVPVESMLSIGDGAQRITIPVHKELRSATYARRSGDVSVALGDAQARFFGPPTEVERARASVAELKSRIGALKAEHRAGEARIAELRRRLRE